MRAKPRLTPADLKKLLPKSLGGDQPPTPDPGHPNLDHHDRPRELDSDAFARGGSVAENRRLAQAIRDTLSANKRHPDRFVLTWRMYPHKDHVPPEGSCGCGCSCT
jgi:hypothetical protein